MPSVTPPQSVQQIVGELFLGLDTVGLIDTARPLPINFKKIVARGQDTNSMLQVWKNLMVSGQLNNLAQATRQWFTSNQIEIIFSNLVILFMLENMEMVKSILKLVLKQNVSVNGIKLEERDTLGQLFNKLSGILQKNYNGLIDNTLRIAIAHNQYWWDNGNLVYMKDGNEIHLSQSDFVNVFNHTSDVAVSIINEIKKRGFTF